MLLMGMRNYTAQSMQPTADRPYDLTLMSLKIT